MRDLIRKPRNWVLAMLVLSVMAALLVSFTSSFSSNLPSYSQPNTTVEPPEQKQPEKTYDTQLFTAEDKAFSMEVPSGWTRAVKDGCDTFLNPNDGARISFAVSAYDPALNMVTQETVSGNVTQSGGLLGAFLKNSNASFVEVYEIGAVDYFEYHIWDLDTHIQVYVEVPAAQYSSYNDLILHLFDTFQWEQPNPIPEGYTLYYSEYGNFEFALPDGWEYGIQNGAFIAQSSESGANFRVTVTNTTSDLSAISQIDYTNVMSAGKSGYMQSAYNNTGSILTSEASFISENVQYAELHSILATGAFQYEFLFQTPADSAEVTMPEFLTVTKCFRVF